MEIFKMKMLKSDDSINGGQISTEKLNTNFKHLYLVCKL